MPMYSTSYAAVISGMSTSSRSVVGLVVNVATVRLWVLVAAGLERECWLGLRQVCWYLECAQV